MIMMTPYGVIGWERVTIHSVQSKLVQILSGHLEIYSEKSSGQLLFCSLPWVLTQDNTKLSVLGVSEPEAGYETRKAHGVGLGVVSGRSQ